jgi:hypothetical protein
MLEFSPSALIPYKFNLNRRRILLHTKSVFWSVPLVFLAVVSHPRNPPRRNHYSSSSSSLTVYNYKKRNDIIYNIIDV